jgi:hypothetical protein
MGCDIHGHFEIKVRGRWLHYNMPRIERNYRLFGRMAGVRGDEKPIVEPRGLPKDMSEITKLEYEWWGVDAHTSSWFNAEEIAEIIEYHESLVEPSQRYKIAHEEWFYLDGNGWDGFLKYRKDYPEEIEDIRFIFWFDN